VDYDNFLEIVKTRRSIRRFKPDPVPDEDIRKIIEAARWAMSGANGQPWEFIIVKSPDIRLKIAEFMRDHHNFSYYFEKSRIPEMRHPGGAIERHGLPTFKDAPVMMVIAGDPRTYQATVLGHQFRAFDGSVFHMNMGNVAMLVNLAACALGLGSAWISISPSTDSRLIQLLDIPDYFKIYTIVPIGYPAYKPPETRRRNADELMHWDKYDKNKFRTNEQVDEFLLSLRKHTRPAYDLKEAKSGPV